MTDPAFTLRAGPSGPVVIGTPGYVLTFNPDGRSVSGQPGGGGGGGVTSVFGRPGPAVVAQAGDYEASEVTNDSSVAGASVADALDTLGTAQSGFVTSVFGRGPVVTAAPGDYEASEVTNDSGVTGASVADALDTLQAEIAALPTPGLQILEISESCSTGDFIGPNGVFDLLKQDGGAVIECSFSAWNAGDVLKVEFWVNAISRFGDHLLSILSATVSLDAGATWQKLAPAQATLETDITGGTPSPTRFTCAASASIACATTPLIRINAFQPLGTIEVDTQNGQGTTLRCTRYAAGAYAPGGTLF